MGMLWRIVKLHEWHLFDWLKDMNVFFFLINLLTTIKSYSCIILFSYLGLLWYILLYFFFIIEKSRKYL